MDCSKAADKQTGAEWAIAIYGRFWAVGQATLSPVIEFFDAKAEAFCLGLEAAFAYPLAQYANNLWSCLDNQAVFNLAHGLSRNSS